MPLMRPMTLRMPVSAPASPYRVGVSIDEPGDPDERSSDTGAGSDPEPADGTRTRRRVPLSWLIAAVVVVALGIWAATRVGQRPSIESRSTTTDSRSPVSTAGPGDPTDRDPAPTTAGVTAGSQATFAENVPARPGTGCSESPKGLAPPPDDPGATQELTVEGAELASYTLDASGSNRSGDDPAPLLVVVSEPGLAVAELETTSALAESTPGWVHALVDPLAGSDRLGSKGLPRLIKQVDSTRCIDLNRVFVVGFGEGARAAGTAACETPELVTGVAMVAGWVEPDCRPDPPVAVRIIAAGDDPSIDAGTALEEIGTAWSEAVGAGDLWVDGRDEETLVRHWSGPGGISVETTATVSGGHEWTLPASLTLPTFLHDTGRATD